MTGAAGGGKCATAAKYNSLLPCDSDSGAGNEGRVESIPVKPGSRDKSVRHEVRPPVLRRSKKEYIGFVTDFRQTLQTEVADSYTIERELGGGGMSRVFLATETQLDRRVVIKVLPQSVAAGISADRFRREIHLATRLQHPHIVPVLTSGEIHGRPYFTMPFIEGESLLQKLERDG